MARQSKAKKRADGFYQRSINVGRKPNGKYIRKTIYAKTIKELEEKTADFQHQLRYGTLSTNEKMTFGELAEIWIEDYKPNLSITTRIMYKRILRTHLLPELSKLKLKDIKTHNLQSIINKMAELGRATSTMKTTKITAAQIMQVAMDNDIVYRNVFRKVTIPKKEPFQRRPLTEEEIEMVKRTYSGHRIGVPVLLLLYCGLRRGELLALTWSDIDFKTKSVNVNKSTVFVDNKGVVKKPKSSSSVRTVPLPDALIDILKKYKKDCRSTMVCPAVSGSMMSQIAFNKAWKSYLHYLNISAGGHDASRSRPKLIVIDHLTPHMFRHTYATILYDAGVDIKSAQRFLGHADISVTLKIYTHLSDKKEREAIDALNKHLDINAVSLKNNAVKIQ